MCLEDITFLLSLSFCNLANVRAADWLCWESCEYIDSKDRTTQQTTWSTSSFFNKLATQR